MHTKEGIYKIRFSFYYLLSTETSDEEDVSESDIAVLCADLAEESCPSPQANTSEVEKRTIREIVSKISFFIFKPLLLIVMYIKLQELCHFN